MQTTTRGWKKKLVCKFFDLSNYAPQMTAHLVNKQNWLSLHETMTARICNMMMKDGLFRRHLWDFLHIMIDCMSPPSFDSDWVCPPFRSTSNCNKLSPIDLFNDIISHANLFLSSKVFFFARDQVAVNAVQCLPRHATSLFLPFILYRCSKLFSYVIALLSLTRQLHSYNMNNACNKFERKKIVMKKKVVAR